MILEDTLRKMEAQPKAEDVPLLVGEVRRFQERTRELRETVKGVLTTWADTKDPKHPDEVLVSKKAIEDLQQAFTAFGTAISRRPSK
jgi:hypothetical protein